MYAGEYDQQDGPVTMYEWMKDLMVVRDDYHQFEKQPRQIYYLPDKDSTGNPIVGGYYRSDFKFTFLTVPKAGHFVPTTNMLATKAFLSDYIEQQSLKCHHTDPVKCNPAPIMCKYMNQCSGHGTCDSENSGKCKCDQGYGGADCSQQI